MAKGFKTSELYVVLFVLVIWGLSMLGVDLSQLFNTAEALVKTAAEVAKELQSGENLPIAPDGSDLKSSAGYWIAALVYGGRTTLKGLVAFKGNETAA